jgi:hypothetical protein
MYSNFPETAVTFLSLYECFTLECLRRRGRPSRYSIDIFTVQSLYVVCHWLLVLPPPLKRKSSQVEHLVRLALLPHRPQPFEMSQFSQQTPIDTQLKQSDLDNNTPKAHQGHMVSEDCMGCPSRAAHSPLFNLSYPERHFRLVGTSSVKHV